VLFNFNNYNSAPKPKSKSKSNTAAKSSKKNAFKMIFSREPLSLKYSSNNKITTKNTLFKLASCSIALVYSSFSYSSLLASRSYSYSYSYSYS
jgi:hypothetical protein